MNITRRCYFAVVVAMILLSMTAQGNSVAISEVGQTFEEIIQQNKYVAVKFWMYGCAPCQVVAPRFEQAALSNDRDVLFVTVNIREHLYLAKKYNIRSVPTILYFSKGELFARHKGSYVSVSDVQNMVYKLARS